MIAIDITDALVAEIAQRVAEINGKPSGDRPESPGRWLRGADAIASYIDCPPSRVYKLATCTPPRIPAKRDGSALMAHTARLDRWVEEGGGISP